MWFWATNGAVTINGNIIIVSLSLSSNGKKN